MMIVFMCIDGLRCFTGSRRIYLSQSDIDISWGRGKRVPLPVVDRHSQFLCGDVSSINLYNVNCRPTVYVR